MISKKDLKAIYTTRQDVYENTCLAGKELLRQSLQEKGIEFLHVSHRVKSFESFYEKISRKKYNDPYLQIEDICGLRVICFYINDLPHVEEILNESFSLQHSEDKMSEFDTDRFGYRSNHYTVTLPHLDEYNNYRHQKIEVQVRTALMHTWAHIQGKLEYKKAEHTPKIFRRKLFQLSALLELADGQFQALKIEKNLFRKSLITSSSEFTPTTELNIDTFMAFMETYFPNRKESYRYSKLLMIEILNCQLNFSHLIGSYQSLSSHFETLESESGRKLTREEMMKLILAISNDQFYHMLVSDEFLTKNSEIILQWKEKQKIVL
ncbi:MAG: RelA/SpoT domain-containing protein [Cyclobacteriaceae bacterium]